MLIVQVCDFGNDGDAEYRMHSPSRQLGALPGVTAIDCHFSHRCLPDLAELADVLVFQFVNDWELLAICERRRAAGKLTVFEANDDFFDLQPWNPISTGWQDRTVQELFLQLIASADAVQTSSTELARRWGESGAKQVVVFPNHLVEIEDLPDPSDRPLTVGWGGSPGHFADWYQLAPRLSRWLAEYPEVHLAVMTNELAQSFVQLAPERYRFTPFGSLADYVRFLRSLDIGLAPLVDTGYNRGRSDVKFLEYASQGVVGIYSDLAPYRSSVVHGSTGFLCRDADDMIAQLERLRTNAAMRHRIRQNAYNEVKANRLLPARISERAVWYRGLLKRTPASNVSLPAAVLAVSGTDRENGYWQLRPQQPEQLFLESLRQPDKVDATKRLREQLEREPNYLAASIRQGQLLNDLRDHQQAILFLERAQALMPQSARILCEIGRARFCMNDFSGARAALEDAIRAEPKCLPAWQYFLRFLSICKPNDGADWAKRSEDLFPNCYPLTLLAAQVYPSAESLTVLKRVIGRMASTIVKRERTTALAAVRQSITVALKAEPQVHELLPLLRTCCEVFPESAWLVAELGSALYRAGQFDEAYAFHSKAWQIRQQAILYRDEFPNQDSIPWSWQFADHLYEHI